MNTAIMNTLLLLLLAVGACQPQKATESAELVPPVQVQEFHLSDSQYVVLPYQADWHWFFEKAKPGSLSEADLVEIEEVLKIVVTENNEQQRKLLEKHNRSHPKEPWTETGFEIGLEGFFRQYVPVINEEGETEIWVNFFCSDWDSDKWRREVMMVHDGGNCYFNVKINLTQKTYRDLEINGYA